MWLIHFLSVDWDEEKSRKSSETEKKRRIAMQDNRLMSQQTVEHASGVTKANLDGFN